MSFIDEFSDVLADSITVQPGVNNEYGEFTPSGSAFAVACRVEAANRLYRNSAGREIISTAQAYCAGVNGLTVDLHRYALPSDAEPSGRSRVALAVYLEHDEDGPSYEVVYF